MKNIILIITDTFRYDNLFRRAKRAIRTPNLDRFSTERAVSVDKCYCGSYPTVPHRTDVATGRVGWTRYGWQPLISSGRNHIARLLGAKGYATQLIADTVHLSNNFFHHGFDAYNFLRGQESDIQQLHLNDPIPQSVPRGKTRETDIYRGGRLSDLHVWNNRDKHLEENASCYRMASTVIRFLEENYKSGPFFLWADFFDPHEPWDPPEYMVRHYDPDYKGAPMIHPNYGPSSDYTPEELHNLWAHYAAEVELADRAFGRVLQKIDDLRLWDDSIVFLVSDHGMSLGEHGRTGKTNFHPVDTRHCTPYPEIGHNPLLIAAPGLAAGATRDIFVQPCDFAPTLCELAGVEVEPPEPFDGISFASCLSDAKIRHRDHAITSTFIKPEHLELPVRSIPPFVTAGHWGYTPCGDLGKIELYDLDRDPLAETNILEGNESVAADLRQLLLDDLDLYGAADNVKNIWRRAGEKH